MWDLPKDKRSHQTRRSFDSNGHRDDRAMTTIENSSVGRRQFLKHSAGMGALILTATLPQRGMSKIDSSASTIKSFVILEMDGQVTVLTPFVEMGQGVHTAIPMLVAEELDVSLDQIQLQEAPLTKEYRLHFGGAMRYTGSSLTIKDAYIPFRSAGAAARSMLLESASRNLQVPVGELSTRNGSVIHNPSGASISYTELIPLALTLPVPSDIKLKSPSEFTLIGSEATRRDAAEKSDGSAIFGIDISLPNLLVACVTHSPVRGGRVKSIAREAAMKMAGVVSVEIIPDGTFSIRDYALAPSDLLPKENFGTVAVVADSYWHAQQALAALEIDYEGGAADFSDERYTALLKSRVNEEGVVAEQSGDFKATFHSAHSRIEAVYDVPLLAHAAMEPMNCTVLYEKEKCTVWTGHQDADWIARIAAKILAIPLTSVTVNTPYLGGSFGRRSNNDYVIQAVALAKKFPGRPIKLIWNREEDFQQDFFRPQVVAKFEAGFDSQRNPIAFRQLVIGDGGQRQQGMAKHLPYDPSLMSSALNQPYSISNKSTEYLLEENPIQVGFWRSVGGAHNGFFIESFIDEMAHASDRDPVAFRMDLLAGSPRFANVLERVATLANWRRDPWQDKDGRRHALGIALHGDHYSIVGEIVEVSLSPEGGPTVHNVWVTADCGTVINAKIAAAQVESAVIFGLSAALTEKMSIVNGRPMSHNFDTYTVLRGHLAPKIHVSFVESSEAPTGLGEPATPPIAAALCNALFNLTGKRLRSLPVGNQLS
ncbi:MAG: acylaldehyde oxidase [Halieaceae bacterium]|nr:acylaldehyde oxidase [Halieaceae bacterium]